MASESIQWNRMHEGTVGQISVMLLNNDNNNWDGARTQQQPIGRLTGIKQLVSYCTFVINTAIWNVLKLQLQQHSNSDNIK